MRWIGPFALATLLLAGCDRAPPLVDAPVMLAAYESFRAGNDVAVGQAHEAVAVRIPRDPEAMSRCDAEGHAARRLARMEASLDFLDSSTAASLGENARFLYLEGLLFGHEAQKRADWSDKRPVEVDCRGSAQGDNAARRLDEHETRAMRDDAERFMSAWRRDRHAALGQDYRSEMHRAAKLLATNHLRASAYWRENGNYD